MRQQTSSKYRNRSNPMNNSDRSKSMDARKSYPNMNKGYNCSYSYDPTKIKFCSKCSLGNSHHEFECQIYPKYEFNICKSCEKYHHETSSCREIQDFPSKPAQNSENKLPKN